MNSGLTIRSPGREPAPGTLLSAFLDYMSTDAAASILQSDDDIPCGMTRLCAS